MRAIASLVILLGCGQSVRTEARPSPAEDPPRERVEVAPTPEPEPEPEPDDPPIVRLALQDERAIDRAVEQALAAGDLPGCVVLVGRSDGVVFRRAYGALQVEPSERPMLPDALFDLASLSKLFTAAAAIRLAERGELDLRAPVDPVLPELAGHGITAEHLLTHRAGLKAVNPLSDYDSDRDASMRRTLEGAPDGPVGTYRYSDLGYIALGELLARRTGQPLDVVITREVSEPLGLDATFRPAPLARVVPTERAAHRGDPPPIIHGEANDPRAWRLGGVAGHAGLFATANDLGVFAEALLEGSWLRPESRARFSTPQSLRDARGRTARRSLGADMTLRAHGWSERSFGHGGYTGTWLWVDPEHDVYLVVLSARVHPNGGGRVGPLRSTLGRLVHQARARMRGPVDSPIRLGIDVLRENDFARLQGKRVALLTNDGGRARDGARTWQLFQRRTDLRKIFTPEHGLAAQQEGAVRNSRIGEIEIVSLFGRTRQPTPEMFEDIDVVVVDLQDVGARFYTYAATLRRLLPVARSAEVDVLVLDRPNPLGGDVVAGPILQEEWRSFVNDVPGWPVRHGLTLGEIARLADPSTEVVLMQGWQRSQWWPETGLRWVSPSPNLRTAEQVLLYPGVALIEGTNVSVGRGTEHPFERVGAPWMDAQALLDAIPVEARTGLRLETATFRPESARHRGRPCRGIAIEVVDPAQVRPIRFGLALLQATARTQPEWDPSRVARLVGDSRITGALTEAELSALEAFGTREREAFETRRASALLY